ncbi:hypothetical protein JGI7_00530 [Candidatus Kryptonium thompsonii]|uniref:Uncharacterized protein n=2 Tax=Candidatus Kryptonium thompsonii TaxID=1633631 RepID=A0A0N7MTH3_9BACT|nr:hypothetical protein [Candidatus Kryptonium thompsoni]CUS77624.1 hypothetical protein JGI10_00158 [Candidatus Kryptonium thompsoni]CUS81640.1 hypothetical protein JGI7_00530 [Candidatus Kryptonium thompsoni]CUS87057.1 hypothetical protein JGI15_103410 [Candidatus Kryptonium thompsoni]CUS90243.1 hypothetical protein JGI12_01342 [Candidatus Kryptonium thompsoni]CUS90856.1 hypothetical protein JGI13_01902 [Candidatus Kryptonium thompsoni]
MKRRKPETILKELEEFVKGLGITLRYERGDFEGGYCVLKEQKMIVINKLANTQKRISLLSQSIVEMGIDENLMDENIKNIVEEELAKLKVLKE